MSKKGIILLPRDESERARHLVRSCLPENWSKEYGFFPVGVAIAKPGREYHL
jgi:hypothetical protein